MTACERAAERADNARRAVHADEQSPEHIPNLVYSGLPQLCAHHERGCPIHRGFRWMGTTNAGTTGCWLPPRTQGRKPTRNPRSSARRITDTIVRSTRSSKIAASGATSFVVTHRKCAERAGQRRVPPSREKRERMGHPLVSTAA